MSCRVVPVRRVREVDRGVDERDMREGLREVPDLTPRNDVELLGEQADVVSKRQQLFEEDVGALVPPDHVKVVDHPERAREEGAFATCYPVDVLAALRVVALYVPVRGEVPFD